MIDHEDYIERVTIRNMADIRSAAEALRDCAAEHGFRASAWVNIASSKQMIDADGALLNAEVFGWTGDGQRWWEEKRLALNSPLARACRYESEPFWCNKDGVRTEWHNPYLEGLSLSNFERYVQAQAIIIVPVHLPFGQIGANGFPPIDQNKSNLEKELREYGQLFFTLSRRFLGSYASIMRTQRWIPSDCELTKREVECLRWAAIGKTDMEISLILELSHATVRYHIQRAGEKLNSVNRSQAVFRAGQLGYLGAAN